MTISKGKHLIVAGVDVQRMSMADPSGWLSSQSSISMETIRDSFSDVLLGQLSSYEQGAGSDSTYTRKPTRVICARPHQADKKVYSVGGFAL